MLVSQLWSYLTDCGRKAGPTARRSATSSAAAVNKRPDYRERPEGSVYGQGEHPAQGNGADAGQDRQVDLL